MDGRLGIFNPIGDFSMVYESQKAVVQGYFEWRGSLIKFTYETEEKGLSKDELVEKVNSAAHRLIKTWNEQTKSFVLPQERAVCCIKKLRKADVKKEIKACQEAMEPLRERFYELIAKLSNKPDDPEQCNLLEMEKQQLVKNIKEVAQVRGGHYFDYNLGLFRESLLVRTINKYQHALNEVLSEDIVEEYYQQLAQVQREFADNPHVLGVLAEFEKFSILDFQEGFCTSICDLFIEQLAKNKNLTAESVVRLAKEFEKGIEDPKHVVRQVIKIRLGHRIRYFRLVTSKKRRMDPYSSIRKYDNLFLKSEGVKYKKLHMKKTNGLVIPENLAPGAYGVTIAIIGGISDYINPWKKKTMIHALAFVKIDEKNSFLLDPNIGLIQCGDAKKTEEQLSKLKIFYEDFGYNTSRFETRISYLVKL